MILAAIMVFIAGLVAAGHYLGWWAALLVFFLGVLVAIWAAKRAFASLLMLPFTLKGRVLRGALVDVHRVEKVSRPRPRKEHGFVDQSGSEVRAETVPTVPGALPPGQDVVDFGPSASAGDGSQSTKGPSQPTKGSPGAPIHDPIVEPTLSDDGPPRIYWRIDATITPHSHAGETHDWEPLSIVLVPFGAKSDPRSIRQENALLPVDVEIFAPGGVTNRLQKHRGALRVRYTFALPLSNQNGRWKFRYYFESLGDIRLS